MTVDFTFSNNPREGLNIDYDTEYEILPPYQELVTWQESPDGGPTGKEMTGGVALYDNGHIWIWKEEIELVGLTRLLKQ